MKIILAAILIFIGSFTAAAQECPPNLICLTQQQANIAAQNARELEAQKEKNRVLEESLKSKDETIAEMQRTNTQNVADLKEALNKTTNELALTKGQLIGAEAMNVRLTAIVDFMLKNGRTKKYGVNF